MGRAVVLTLLWPLRPHTPCSPPANKYFNCNVEAHSDYLAEAVPRPQGTHFFGCPRVLTGWDQNTCTAYMRQ